MTTTRLKYMITGAVRVTGKWSVWVHFDRHLYNDIRDDLKDKRALPFDALTYLRTAVSHDDSVVTPVWVDGHCLFHFDSREAATAFFARFLDGSLVGAELYNPQGEFQDDNT